MSSSGPARPDCDYVVVGSGAGGGTLAARLVEAGHRVVLLEAGGDPRGLAIDPAERQAHGLPHVYDVPAFHSRASETEEIAWDFFVRHYSNDDEQRRDSKYAPQYDGVLYPRGGTLGGCTAINELILMCPRAAAWDGIAALTGDASWRAERMQTYFERLENCHYRPIARLLGKLGINPSGHGWNGWLTTEVAVTPATEGDRHVADMIRAAVGALARARRTGSEALWLRAGGLDPNDWRVIRASAEQLCYTPLTTSRHQRTGSRERILETARRYPDRLVLELNALATRVLFDEGNRAVGIEYLKGERLFRANRRASTDAGEKRQVHAAREVILAGGTFNTPQLLMLSGIGPRDVLDRHGIAVRVNLPGVGRNLTDNYEVSVVNRMSFASWPAFEKAEFSETDPQILQWASARRGPYNTVGTLLGVMKRSAVHLQNPDLFCYALAERFRGYFRGYSDEVSRHRNYLTWVIVKADTHNRAGTVTLRSSDPRDAPLIDFRYFHEGDDAHGDDLRAIIDGIRFVRGMAAELRRAELIGDEELPGVHCLTDEDLRQFVRAEAWGAAASGSCSIGPGAEGVLTSDFRVHGTENLRVVDASTFPHSPGFFIAGAVYMIGEKAADVILADASRTSA